MHSALDRFCQRGCPRAGLSQNGRPVSFSRAAATSFLPPPTGRHTHSTWATTAVSSAQRIELVTSAAATHGSGDVSTSGNGSGLDAEASRSSSSTGGGGGGGTAASQLGAKRRRLQLYRDEPTINWDRFELGVYRRIDEREKAGAAPGEGDGPAEEDEDASPTSWFAEQVAGSDLTAAYFRRWDDPAVHQPLLQDRVLTGAWRDALSSAPPGALEGKTVLDVGCGLGLLSMLAAKAGAARVIAVDGSEGAVEAARRIIRVNKLDDRITVVHAAIEELDELPGAAPGEVDVVVSNWMGAGLLAGGMVNAVAHAVKTWLRPGGLVLPDKVSLWAVGLEDRDALQEAKDAWSRVAGLDMSAALAQAVKHPRRDVLTRKSQLLTAPQRLAEWRTAELRPEAVVDPESGAYAVCPFRLTAVRDERLFGLVLYWEAHWTFGGALEGEDRSPVRFTTHPLAFATHYQQLMLDFPRSMRVAVDDEISGQVVLRPGGTDPRDLELDVQAEAVPAAAESGPGSGAAAAPVSASYRVSHLA